MTPDEWLLQQFDRDVADIHAKRGNHTRPLFSLLDDCPPGSSEQYPMFNGEARWPVPSTYCDLEWQARRVPRTRPTRTDVYFAPEVISA